MANKDQQPHAASTLPQIPSLPPPAKGWPTPWLAKSEVEEYLHPLYRRGWRPEVRSTLQQQEAAFLTVEYPFKTFESAISFVGDVGAIARDEDHHPSTMTITYGKLTKVSMVCQTHSAKRPRLPSESGSGPHVKIPGITTRDMRFAILVESHYGAGYECEDLLNSKVHAAREDGAEWSRIVEKLLPEA